MKPVVTGADMHGIHEFEKGSIDDAGYGNPTFKKLQITLSYLVTAGELNKEGAA